MGFLERAAELEQKRVLETIENQVKAEQRRALTSQSRAFEAEARSTRNDAEIQSYLSDIHTIIDIVKILPKFNFRQYFDTVINAAGYSDYAISLYRTPFMRDRYIYVPKYTYSDKQDHKKLWLQMEESLAASGLNPSAIYREEDEDRSEAYYALMRQPYLKDDPYSNSRSKYSISPERMFFEEGILYQSESFFLGLLRQTIPLFEPQLPGIGVRFKKVIETRDSFVSTGRKNTESRTWKYNFVYLRISPPAQATITGTRQSVVDLRDFKAFDDSLEEVFKTPATISKRVLVEEYYDSSE